MKLWRSPAGPCRGGGFAAPGRRGMVLLAVLIVVAILMLVGYQFHNLMAAEFEAVHASNRFAHGRLLAGSGLDYAALVLSQPQTVGLSDAADSKLVSPILIYHNPSVFQRRPVNSANPRYQGYFSIVAPRDPDDSLAGSEPLRYGVEDESGKINVNALLRLEGGSATAKQMLQKLPDGTEDTANAILNWVRATATETANADMLHYSGLGYQIKYGPFESHEELLLIRGITPRLLLGNDLNRNGVLDADEDASLGTVDRGWSRFLTVYSREQNIDAQGLPRIFVNDSDLTGLWDRLNSAVGESLANFIVGYRLHGSSGGSGTEVQAAISDGGMMSITLTTTSTDSSQAPVGTLSRDDLDLTATETRVQIESLYDLVGAEFEITKDGTATRYKSPLPTDDVAALRDLLPLVFDKLTTTQEANLPARININTAPREVLLTLPNLTETDVQNILDHRPTADTDPATAWIYRTPAWLMTEAGFQKNTVQALEPYVTARSFVFRVQVIGYYEMGGPVVRLEAVIDTTGGRPRFLHWRDLTELGRGYDPQVLMNMGY